MFNFFNLEISQIIKSAEDEMFELNHPYVGTEHLLLSLLKNSESVASIANEYNLNYDNFKKELLLIVGSSNKKSTYILYTPLLKKVISEAIELANKENIELNSKHLLASIISEAEGIAIRLLLGMNIDIESMYERLTDSNNTNKVKLELLEIGKNLNETVDNKDRIIEREKEINQVIETLIRKNKNNPLLIGEAGVGKTAIVEEIARRINKGEIVDELKNKQIIMIEMGSLVAGTKYRGEFEERLTNIIKELINNPNYIIFIDEIHSMVNAGGAEGAINASDILKPYLARGEIKCIGATTIDEYNKHISKDKALNRRFEIINVSIPDDEKTIKILKKVKKTFEQFYNIKITDQNIKDIVSLTNKYMYSFNNPDKSIDLLDTVCASKSIKKNNMKNNYKFDNDLLSLKKQKEKYVKNNKFNEAVLVLEKIKYLENMKNSINIKNRLTITKEDIYESIYNKCNIPNKKEKKELLKKLKKDLVNNVYGQDEVNTKIINLVSKYLQKEEQFSFLFNGYVGVGKSFIAKKIANNLKLNFINIDMKQFMQEYTIIKLIGANNDTDNSYLFSSVKNNPYTLLLIENIEYAANEVERLIEQIITDGIIVDGKNQKISFKNALIIITNNKSVYNLGFNNELKSNNNSIFNKVDYIINFNQINEISLKKYLKEHKIEDKDILKKYNYHEYGFKNIAKYIKTRDYVA